jgi:hypothetical protein
LEVGLRGLLLACHPFISADRRYTHADSVLKHLELLKFLLREMQLSLTWFSTKSIWETLVENAILV